MALSELCIRRPVFSTVLSLVLIIIGIVSYTYLSVRQYPQVDRPIISVTTSYEGAGPEIIETQITKPIEGVLAGIEGLDYMTSRSEAENSVIKLYFKPERELDAAASDVRDRLGRVKERLPRDAPDPTIKKTDADAEPVLYLALTSKTLETPELYRFADKYLKDQVQAVTGVANVEVYGSAPMVMHIWLDPEKLAAYELTVQDVSQALKNQNVEIPAGRIVSKEREFNVTTAAKLRTVNQYDNLVIKERQNYIIRLKDVGYAEFSPGEQRSSVFFNGQPAASIEIIKKSTANPLELIDSLKSTLPKLRQTLPQGMSIEIAYDTSIYIQESIDQVYKTLLEAIILVIVVIWLFLWSIRGALIPLVTIPVSLVATFALMYAFGFTINVLTLLALVLAIGLVVDDAIVMLENIYRYVEEGEHPFSAAIKGAKEITFSVISMTLTLAAVYAPIALSKGLTGKMFIEFALTLAGSVIVSGIVALTLTPTMCSRMLKPHMLSEDNLHSRILSAIENGYGKLVALSVKGRWWMLAISLIIAGVGIYMGKSVLKSELAPREDQGIIWGRADGEQGTSLAYLDRYVRQLDEILDLPQVTKQLSVVTVPTAVTYNILKPWSERKESSLQIRDSVQQEVWDIPGMNAYASIGGTLIGGSGSSDSFSFVLQTTQSYQELSKMADIIEQAMVRHKGFERVQADISPDAQEYYVNVNRDKLASVGLDVQTVGETLDALVSGRTVTKFRWDGEQYDVKTQLVAERRLDPQDLNKIYLKAQQGNKTGMVPLANVVNIERRPIPTEINHFNQLKSITISANLVNGFALSEAVEFLDNLKDRLLTDNFRTEYSGGTRQFLDSQYTIYLIFGLALIFIYLIMAAQFESFVDPFIIMFSVPLSITGAIITLWIVGGTLNIFSQIGLVTLIGLITKHGILIVDFANSLRREKGYDLRAAVLASAKLRLRPVLMTTAAMVLGALPLAFITGAGANGLNQIGWVIVGGMSFGTLLTLFVIPAIYTFFSPK